MGAGCGQFVLGGGDDIFGTVDHGQQLAVAAVREKPSVMMRSNRARMWSQ